MPETNVRPIYFRRLISNKWYNMKYDIHITVDSKYVRNYGNIPLKLQDAHLTDFDISLLFFRHVN